MGHGKSHLTRSEGFRVLQDEWVGAPRVWGGGPAEAGDESPQKQSLTETDGRGLGRAEEGTYCKGA